MRAVFLDKSTISDDVCFSILEQQVTNISYFDKTPATKIIYRCRFAEVLITNKVVLDRESLQQLPKLRLICIAATGSNNIDLQAAKELGIAVFNVNDYSTQSVSQYVFSMLLEIFQNTSTYINDTREGKWQSSTDFCHFSKPINELSSATLGIVGYGKLGQAVAKIAQAFNMKVIIAERAGATEVRPGRLSFEEMLSQADIVSIHCPLGSNTYHLFNEQTIGLMKRGAILINTARGGLVQSSSLISALKSKQLRAAVLDVLEEEPPAPDNQLINAKLSNLYITAHIAWGSMQAQQRLINGIADNISNFAQNISVNRIV